MGKKKRKDFILSLKILITRRARIDCLSIPFNWINIGITPE